MSFSRSPTHLRMDPARISTSCDAVEFRAADMATRRAVLEESVEALLSTWRGEAALRFGALWVEWRDNADSVIDGLGGSLDSLRGARDLTCAADTGIGAAHDRLRGRLG